MYQVRVRVSDPSEARGPEVAPPLFKGNDNPELLLLGDSIVLFPGGLHFSAYFKSGSVSTGDVVSTSLRPSHAAVRTCVPAAVKSVPFLANSMKGDAIVES